MKAKDRIGMLTFPGQDDDVLIMAIDELWWFWELTGSELVPMTDEMIIDELKAIVSAQDDLIAGYKNQIGEVDAE